MVSRLPFIFYRSVVPSLNVALHTVCSLLLFQIYRQNNRSKPQHLYLLNLSVAELLKNFRQVIHSVSHIPKNDQIVWVHHELVMEIFNSSLFVSYILAMFLLTADRLCASLLNIRYNSKCTVFKAKVCSYSQPTDFVRVY